MTLSVDAWDCKRDNKKSPYNVMFLWVLLESLDGCHTFLWRHSVWKSFQNAHLKPTRTNLVFWCNGVLALKRTFYGLFFTGFQTVWCQLFSHVYHKKLPIYWNRSKSALNICKLCARLFTISFSWQFPPSIGHVKKNMYVGTFKKVIRQMTQSLKPARLVTT